MSCPGDLKSSWPELVGKPGEVAVRIIESENKDVNAMIVEEGSLVSTDFLCERVRVFVNHDKILKLVTRVPRVG